MKAIDQVLERVRREAERRVTRKVNQLREAQEESAIINFGLKYETHRMTLLDAFELLSQVTQELNEEANDWTLF